MESIMGGENAIESGHLCLAGEFLEHMASFPGAKVLLNDGKLKLTPDGGIILSAEFRLDTVATMPGKKYK